jgi:hypothetical protein
MTSFTDRYLAGQHVAVWTEIIGLGDGLRSDTDTLQDAEAVGRETTQRARRNVERLIEELPKLGYVFEPGEGLAVYASPSPDVVSELDEIERRVGPMPLAFRWWLEDVGEVNLMGHHEDWRLEDADPLVVQAPPPYIMGEIDAWEDDLGTAWERRPFTIDFSPDRLHKANVSGGPPYSLAVPCAAADGLVLWERHQTTFVNHLRIAFRHGGFLGFDAQVGRPETAVPDELLALARSLEPI